MFNLRIRPYITWYYKDEGIKKWENAGIRLQNDLHFSEIFFQNVICLRCFFVYILCTGSCFYIANRKSGLNHTKLLYTFFKIYPGIKRATKYKIHKHFNKARWKNECISIPGCLSVSEALWQKKGLFICLFSCCLCCGPFFLDALCNGISGWLHARIKGKL